MAHLSSQGKHVVASKGGHWIQLDEPDLVIESIREVVESVGRRRPQMSGKGMFVKVCKTEQMRKIVSAINTGKPGYRWCRDRAPLKPERKPPSKDWRQSAPALHIQAC